MNGVNLNAFQFEYDLTWMSFFQNSEGRTYARYGGREDDGPETHLTKASLMKTMNRVLKLHKANKARPWSKYEPRPETTFTPEQIPPMKGMLAKRKEKCIHCHDVKNATLYNMQDHGEFKKRDVFTYPSPKQLGIVLDADDQILAKDIIKGSAAAKAGLMKGDTVALVANQPVLTFADFSRVLELAPQTGDLSITTARNGKPMTVQVRLAEGWKRSTDPSWRASTGAIGPNSGFWARQLKPDALGKLKLGDDELALKVVVVWGAWAKKAGLKNGDVVTKIDGRANRMTIRQLQTHLQLNREYGDEVKLTIHRAGESRELTMKLPAKPERH